LGVKKTAVSLCVAFFLLAVSLCFADDVSFHRVKVPTANGKQIPAVLTFSDGDKALEVHPAKGDAVTIPYSAIDKASYEYTQKHRVNEGTVATAATGVGAVLMFTKSKSHWLEIDYHEQDTRKVFVLRMDKDEYLQILDALKAHAGIDAEILGNAKKIYATCGFRFGPQKRKRASLRDTRLQVSQELKVKSQKRSYRPKYAAFFAVNSFHFSGRSSSAKMADTGHTGTHAPQSIHSTGSI
jgi:hypothetical protein